MSGHGRSVESGPEQKSPAKPIAVIGMACRFPGDANSLDRFWTLLQTGADAIGEVPPDRWSIDAYYHPDAKALGQMYTRWGGFISDFKKFDADFFGISPREAEQMDPQQRLLLELTWEAVEEANVAIESLAGSDTAVYVGISSHEYGSAAFNEPESLSAYSATGNSLSIAANRISYTYDLRGPSQAIDTACSSALVALHDGCLALWRGESRIAIVGGVNALMSPHSTVAFCRASMLSPTGRCRAFSAEADGYVRAEGGGVVLLKLLEDALRDGDRIHGVILGAGVNQDGRTAGLAMPSATAQEALLRRVYAEAGIDPADVAYVEAHGTGTPVGDPIECGAIGNALGKAPGRRSPCLIGSVKTNVGHLESASGMAGLFKVILALRNKEIPASLHSTNLNPNIPFGELNLSVVTKKVPLDDSQGRAIFGVNSFGFGGTNAHVIVAAHDGAANGAATGEHKGDALMLLSARSQPALEAVARQYAEFLRGSDQADLAAIAGATALRRSKHPHRLAVVGSSAQEIADRLIGYAKGEAGPRCAVGRAPKAAARVGFLFSGNGSQWEGMGQDLLLHDPVFAAAIEEIDAVFRPLSGWSLREEMACGSTGSRMERTEFAQPMLFAFQVALSRSLQARGLSPAVVAGHSVGEVAAACVAGRLPLQSATRVIFVRSRSQQRTHGIGRMAAAGLSAESARTHLKDFAGLLTLAAINSPSSVTISGEDAALAELGERLSTAGVFYRILPLAYSFHSHNMDPIRAEVLKELDDLPALAGSIPLISAVTGGIADGIALDAEYWWRNIRDPVKFDAVIERMSSDNIEVFVEIGPHPVLEGYVRENLRALDRSGTSVATGRRNEPEAPAVLLALGKAHANGAAVDLNRAFPVPASPMTLPAYPWQREFFDLPSIDPAVRRLEHPLLGVRMRAGEPIWSNKLWANKPGWIRDHVVAGNVMLPGAAFVELALAAAALTYGPGPLELTNFELRKALVLADGAPQQIEVHLSAEDGLVQFSSGGRLPGDQVVHGRGRVAVGAERTRAPKNDLNRLKRELGGSIGTEHIYAKFMMTGLNYGSAFRSIAELWSGRGQSLARLEAPTEISNQIGQYRLHPAILDGCLQTAIGALPDMGPGAAPYVPAHVGRLRFEADVANLRWCHARIRSLTPRSLLVDYFLLDENETQVGRIEEVRLVRFEQAVHNVRTYEWQVVPSPHADVARLSPLRTREPKSLTMAAVRGAPTPQYHTFFAEIRELSAAYAARAFLQMGLGERPLDPAEAAAQGGVISNQVKHFQALWALLVDARLLVQDGGSWRLSVSPERADPVDMWRRLLLTRPGYVTELQLIGRAGDLTADVLRGKADPLQIIFPGGDSGLLEAFYGTSASSTYTNEMASRLIREIVAEWPHDRPLRILEVGAGTGGLTRVLLPMLPPGRIEYVFTDVTEALLSRAQSRFSDWRFLRFATLDLEKSLQDQGFATESFDLVIGANVVHATTSVTGSLGRLHDTLRPGGMILLVEAHPSDVLTLIFGGLAGWRCATDRRSTATSPLLNEADWPAAMEASGFRTPILLTDAIPETAASLSLILAQRPAPDVVADVEQPFEAGRNCLVIADLGENSSRQCALADSIRSRIEKAGGHCSIARARSRTTASDGGARIEPTDPAEYARILSTELKAGSPLTDVIHLWSIPDRKHGDVSMPSTDQNARAVSAILLSQALPAHAGGLRRRVWFVTAGAQAVGDKDFVDPWQAPIWGAARTLMTERTDLEVRLVDLGPDDDARADSVAMLRELAAPGDENEVLCRGTSRFVPRLVPAGDGVRAENHAKAGETPAFQLVSNRRNALDGFCLRKSDLLRPGAGEIVAEVRAAALNFRDVLMKLGVLPDEAFERGFAGPTMGMEFAGRVVALGEGVNNLAVGQNVFGFARSAFASHVVAPAMAVLPMPDHFDYAGAATLPAVGFTVIYGLSHLARLAAGERVLIHGAAGGVGFAAIQYAQHVGADVFATAGTAEKRTIIQRLGVRHIFDSRSTAFADDVLDATEGEGVDVILNSLAGAAIQKNLSILRPYGRFIELGKRDFFSDSRIGLRPFRKNISFFGVDVDQILIDQPRLAAHLFKEFHGMLASGALHPLPHRTFPLTDATEAFRLMQQSRHVGKIVLDVTRAGNVVEDAQKPTFELRPDATYAVIGGLGGFGMSTARWLVGKGARSLVLVGRSGSARAEAVSAVEELRALGADVRVIAADITDLDQTERIVRIVNAEMPPLRGVIHAAMVIDDALSVNLTADRIRSVLAPKTIGAWNLHLATRKLPLDFFVLYSSAAAVIGNEGQSNYSAANLFLDSLARYRQSQGLPGIAIAWGAIGDVGYLADRAAVRKILADKFGLTPMPAARALDGLGRAIQAGAPYVVVAQMNWGRLFRVAHIASNRRFSELKAEAELAGVETEELEISDIRSSILGMPRAEAVVLVQQRLTRQIAKVLRLAPHKLDPERSLLDLGMDSLMVVEMQMAVEENLGVALSGTELIDKPTISALAQRLTDRLLGSETRRAPGPAVAAASVVAASNGLPAPASSVAPVEEGLGAMSDESVYDLVSRMAELPTLPNDAGADGKP